MRNGFSTEVEKVKDFNDKVRNGHLKQRALGLIYTQTTLRGNYRKSGWVAYDYDRTAWGKTKKAALALLSAMDDVKCYKGKR
ncbi:MAG: hypothetical protein WD512_07765 [Candidatus Paceibacterota bacterium]